jgi:hypothetical protein
MGWERRMDLGDEVNGNRKKKARGGRISSFFARFRASFSSATASEKMGESAAGRGGERVRAAFHAASRNLGAQRGDNLRRIMF